MAKLFIAADHGGFELKDELKTFFNKKKIAWTDLGAHVYEKNDDYPGIAAQMAKAISMNKGSRGILICGSGTGMCIAANRFKHIRAAMGYDTHSAKMSRKDNDANILCLKGYGYDKALTKKIVTTWLKTPFSKAARHKRRIKKLG